MSPQPPTEIRFRFVDPLLQAKSFCRWSSGHGFLTSLPKNGFYEEFQCWVHVVFYIVRFIPKLVSGKNTLRVTRRDTSSFGTPVVTGVGEGARQKIHIHQVFNGCLLKFGPGTRDSLPSPIFLTPGSPGKGFFRNKILPSENSG